MADRCWKCHGSNTYALGGEFGCYDCEGHVLTDYDGNPVSYEDK